MTKLKMRKPRLAGRLALCVLVAIGVSAERVGAHDGQWKIVQKPAFSFASRVHQPGPIIVADIDCDRRDDLVHFDATGINVLLWRDVKGGAWTTRSYGIFRNTNITAGDHQLVGDFNGDGCGDIALVKRGSQSVPVIYGKYRNGVELSSVGNLAFAGLLAESGVTPLVGDFDGDGVSDIAAVKHVDTSGVSWGVVPVAYGIRGTTRFRVKIEPVPGIRPLTRYGGGQFTVPKVGDFNGDGRDEIALVRLHPKPDFLHVASLGSDRRWRIAQRTFSGVPDDYRVRNAWNGARAERFFGGNRDLLVYVNNIFNETPGGNQEYRTAINVLLPGPTTWQIDGVLLATHYSARGRPSPRPTVISGDFDADGRPEFAVFERVGVKPDHVRITTWDHLLNNNYPRRRVGHAGNVRNFAHLRLQSRVQHHVGDFNGDGADDIALVRRGPGWSTVPVAFSLGHAMPN